MESNSKRGKTASRSKDLVAGAVPANTTSERKPSIRDVADRAKVAVGTVSRVINRQPNVRDDKRRRVLDAIVELNYVPDIVAQTMRTNRSMTMACVMRDFTVPVLSMFVDSMQKEIDPVGFSLMVASSYHDVKREIALLNSFQQRRIDGLAIATSSESDVMLLATLEQMPFPIVLIDRERPAKLEELASEFGISCERVRQVEVRAFEKLRRTVVSRIAEIQRPCGAGLRLQSGRH